MACGASVWEEPSLVGACGVRGSHATSGGRDEVSSWLKMPEPEVKILTHKVQVTAKPGCRPMSGVSVRPQVLGHLKEGGLTKEGSSRSVPRKARAVLCCGSRESEEGEARVRRR